MTVSIKLKTSTLNDMVSKAVKCCSFNKMLPLTSLLHIQTGGGKLTISSTDGTNYAKISCELLEQPEVSLSVNASTFSKLVSKTTTAEVELIIDDSAMTFIGNGEYNLEIPVDEEGDWITIDIPKCTSKKATSLLVHKLKSVTVTNKACLATTLEVPCLTGYYFTQDMVITSDGFQICCNDEQLMDKEVLMSPEIMSLCSIFEGEEVNLISDDNLVVISSKDSNIEITGIELEGKEMYPVDAINHFMSQPFSGQCKVGRQALLEALDRMSLFVSPYDNKAINLYFDKTELNVNSYRTNSSESVVYQSDEEVTNPFSCSVDVDMFKSVLNSHSSEIVEIDFGNEAVLKLKGEKVSHIISMVDPEE